MAEPLITVGITCYREGQWLRDCWQSVLAQTDHRWEAVMVMDGGADAETRRVFAEIEHPRLRKYAFPRNVGPYPARNRAFELTRTPWHFYLDADDLLFPHTLASVAQYVAAGSDVDFVYGDLELFGGRRGYWRYPHDLTPADYTDRQPIPCTAAYTKRMWRQLGGFAAEFARGNADYDFFIGAAAARFRGRHCGRVYYRYRTGHPGKVSESYLRHYHRTHETMVARHPGFFADDYRRKRFLGCGYRKAAIANLAASDTTSCARLARRALYHGMWRDPALLSMALADLPFLSRFVRALPSVVPQPAPGVQRIS